MTDIRHSILHREIGQSRIQVAFCVGKLDAEAIRSYATIRANNYNDRAEWADNDDDELLFRSLAWAWAEKAIGETID